MSRGRPLVRQGLLLAIVAALLVLPALIRPSAYTGWPALGFAVAFLLGVRRERRWASVALLTLVSAPALSLSYEVPLHLGLLGALALSLPSLFVAANLLRGGHTQRGALVDLHSGHYLLVTLVGALLNSTLAVLVALTDHGLLGTLYVTVTTVLATQSAQLVVLPLLLRTSDRPAAAGKVERATQRVVLVAVFVGLFWPTTTPGLSVVLLPAVGWAAVRSTQRETHLQNFVVCVAAYVLTLAGHGPFADPTPAGLPADLAPAQVFLYIMALCYATVPLALAVDRLSVMTRQATRAASTVERLLDSAEGTMIIATDARGRITRYNRGAEQTLGYPPEAVLGHSTAMFHTAEEIARHAADMGVTADHSTVALEMVRRGSSRDWEFIHQDGSARMTSLTVSPVTDPDGRVVAYLGAGEDITERLRVQEALSTALEREHMSVLRLQEVDDVKQDLVSNVSHELRTPITSISGYTELLVDGSLGDLNEAQADAVRRIERNTGRLGLLVEDLLTLSRAESGALELEHTEVDLREVAAEALDMAGEARRTRGLEVHLEAPGTPVHVLGDALALERAVTNLVVNAIKFTPDGGAVTLSVHEARGDRTGEPRARLSVSDTGMGISEEDQAHLFTRFYRASQATERAIQGTGLGLSIVHAIVTQHGGEVCVESSPGQGTTVTLLLPAYGS